MKLPIAGQPSPLSVLPSFSATDALERAIVVVAEPGLSPWPFLEGITVPIFRASSASDFELRMVTQPLSHQDVRGTPSQIAEHIGHQTCVVLGEWAASWAQAACRVWLTRSQIRGSARSEVPWDLVLSQPRPRLLAALVQKIR